MSLAERYAATRAASLALCAPLEIEDHLIQSMPDASPLRWHLAHTTWFFETFVLAPYTGRAPPHPAYTVLFNSYYEGVGAQFPRHLRGTQSRPTVAQIRAWRAEVDDAIGALLARSDDPTMRARVELGIHHEQQHQELMVTDLKHGLLSNPLEPIYDARCAGPASAAAPAPPVAFAGGVHPVGHAEPGFHFDNERPAHQAFLQPFRLHADLVTNAAYLDFMADGGYRRPDLWLSDGWHTVQAEGWLAPLYWRPAGDEWTVGTLGGPKPVDPHAPVTHVSFFEADAYARWAGHRLPTEFEWEHAARAVAPAPDGTFADDGDLHPVGRAAPCHGGLRHLLGEVWEWTASAYLPYPGFRPAPGAIGEYNGKFMNGQRVLRGGSCATPRDHVRLTYRNFFQPEKRWQFSGIRLAEDA